MKHISSRLLLCHSNPLLYIIMAMAALTLAWGCSSGSDDSDDAAEFLSGSQPQWSVDMNDSQERPSWTAPDPSLYENKMIVMLRLQDELVPYSTDDDLMAVFVGNNCRALSTRAGNGQKIFFVLNVHGNNEVSAEHFTLSYYSGGLRQLFTLSGKNTFLNELNVGVEGNFSPPLLTGSTKYPVKTEVTVNVPNKFFVLPADMAAVFVGDECRGVGKPGEPFIVFGLLPDEQGTLRYYNADQGGIYTASAPLFLNGEPQAVSFQ